MIKNQINIEILCFGFDMHLSFYNRHAATLFMVQCYGASWRFFNALLPAAIRAFGALFRPLGSIRAF